MRSRQSLFSSGSMRQPKANPAPNPQIIRPSSNVMKMYIETSHMNRDSRFRSSTAAHRMAARDPCVQPRGGSRCAVGG